MFLMRVLSNDRGGQVFLAILLAVMVMVPVLNGLPADNPLHLSTCDQILASAHKHGIKAVMHCAGAEFAAGAVARGFDMVMLTSDLNSMIAGARQQLDAFNAKTGK